MKIRFWGVRGSNPVPLNSCDIKEKISSILYRVKPEDLLNEYSREKFLNSLPDTLFGTMGGNTACVEIELSDNKVLVFDCGTGLREFYKNMKNRSIDKPVLHYHIFLSHFHYDHLMGLPYFPPLYDEHIRISFYSPYSAMEQILVNFTRKPYHPVGFDSFKAQIDFNKLDEKTLEIGEAKIDWIKRNHPDGTIAYRIKEGDKVCIYSTDTELEEKNFKMTRKNKAFFKDVDLIILDSQYTLLESIDKSNWGHSSFSLAVEFANVFKIKKLYLFHHEPVKGDRDIQNIEVMARSYQAHINEKYKGHQVYIEMAKEGLEVEI